jgi:hypothetical protein
MKTNGIKGADDQQVSLGKIKEVGNPAGEKCETVHGEKGTPGAGRLSSLIAQHEIAGQFVRMDSASDSVDRPPQNSGRVSHEVPLCCENAKTVQEDNFRAIVYDETKWHYFVQSVTLKAPQPEAAKKMRMELIKSFECGDWRQVKDNPLFQELMSWNETPEFGLLKNMGGINKRIDLWLEDSDFFKQLFTDVQNGDLPSRPNLGTDNRLIDFVLSLPEDAD